MLRHQVMPHGVREGYAEEESKEESVGLSVGVTLGVADEEREEDSVGATVGLPAGDRVGFRVGDSVGPDEGAPQFSQVSAQLCQTDGKSVLQNSATRKCDAATHLQLLVP